MVHCSQRHCGAVHCCLSTQVNCQVALRLSQAAHSSPSAGNASAPPQLLGSGPASLLSDNSLRIGRGRQQACEGRGQNPALHTAANVLAAHMGGSYTPTVYPSLQPHVTHICCSALNAPALAHSAGSEPFSWFALRKRTSSFGSAAAVPQLAGSVEVRVLLSS